MDTLHAAFDQYLISHPHFHLLPLLEFLPIGFHLHLSLLHLFDSVLLIDTWAINGSSVTLHHFQLLQSHCCFIHLLLDHHHLHWSHFRYELFQEQCCLLHFAHSFLFRFHLNLFHYLYSQGLPLPPNIPDHIRPAIDNHFHRFIAIVR